MTARILVSWAAIERDPPIITAVVDASPTITLVMTVIRIPIAHVKAQVSAAGGRAIVSGAN
jgi:hypothetical protein